MVNKSQLPPTHSCSMLHFDQPVLFTACHYASEVYAVVVCPSVTSRHCTKMAKRRITQIMPDDTPGF